MTLLSQGLALCLMLERFGIRGDMAVRQPTKAMQDKSVKKKVFFIAGLGFYTVEIAYSYHVFSSKKPAISGLFLFNNSAL